MRARNEIETHQCPCVIPSIRHADGIEGWRRHRAFKALVGGVHHKRRGHRSSWWPIVYDVEGGGSRRCASHWVHEFEVGVMKCFVGVRLRHGNRPYRLSRRKFARRATRRELLIVAAVQGLVVGDLVSSSERCDVALLLDVGRWLGHVQLAVGDKELLRLVKLLVLRHLLQEELLLVRRELLKNVLLLRRRQLRELMRERRQLEVRGNLLVGLRLLELELMLFVLLVEELLLVLLKLLLVLLNDLLLLLRRRALLELLLELLMVLLEQLLVLLYLLLLLRRRMELLHLLLLQLLQLLLLLLELLQLLRRQRLAVRGIRHHVLHDDTVLLLRRRVAPRSRWRTGTFGRFLSRSSLRAVRRPRRIDDGEASRAGNGVGALAGLCPVVCHRAAIGRRRRTVGARRGSLVGLGEFSWIRGRLDLRPLHIRQAFGVRLARPAVGASTPLAAEHGPGNDAVQRQAARRTRRDARIARAVEDHHHGRQHAPAIHRRSVREDQRRLARLRRRERAVLLRLLRLLAHAFLRRCVSAGKSDHRGSRYVCSFPLAPPPEAAARTCVWAALTTSMPTRSFQVYGIGAATAMSGRSAMGWGARRVAACSAMAGWMERDLLCGGRPYLTSPTTGALRAASCTRIWCRRPVLLSRTSSSVRSSARATTAYSSTASWPPRPTWSLSRSGSSGSWASVLHSTRAPCVRASTSHPWSSKSTPWTQARYDLWTRPSASDRERRVAALRVQATSMAPLTGLSRRCTAAANFVLRSSSNQAATYSFTLASPVLSCWLRTPFGLFTAITWLSAKST